ncbi:MAG: hypothetical protein ACYC0V_18070 [Armatimonadota bacterium]
MKRYIASFTLIIYIFSIGCVTSQELTANIVSTNPVDTETVISVVNPDALISTSEKFQAKNNKGPFNLQWKPVARDTERIVIDTTPMQKGIDYKIDYGSGMIAFNEPVDAGKMIEVDYKYDPTIATRNKSALNIPLSLYLYKKENVGLQFIGLYKQADQTKTSESDMAVIGLAGNKKMKNSDLSSMFLFNSGRPGDVSDNSSFLDRSAIKLGSTTTAKNLQFNASYLRTGADFAASKEYQLQQGMETMDFSAVFNAGKGLTFNSSYNKLANLNENKNGETSAVTTNNIEFNAAGAPKLSVTRVETNKTANGIDAVKTVNDTIRMEKTLGVNTSATAIHQSTSVDSGASSTRTSTDQLLIGSRLAPNLGLAGSLIRNNTTQDGVTDIVGLTLDNQPSKYLTLKAGISRADNEKTGADNAETFNLNANLSKKMTFAMDMTHRNTDMSGDEVTHLLRINSSLRPDTQVELSMYNRNVSSANDESTNTAKISSTAIKNTKLLIDWQNQNSDINGKVDTSKLQVEAAPMKIMTITGAIAQKDSSTSHDLSSEARIALTPSQSVAIGGAYSEVTSNGSIVARIREANAAYKPIRLIQMVGLYKTRNYAGLDDLDSVNLSLTLDTGRLMKFIGSYVENPEDAKGVIKKINSQTIGVNSDLGIVKLKGAFTLNDEYLVGKTSDRTEVGADVQVARNSLLNTGYSVDRQDDGTLLATSIYSLGFTHSAGNNLSLYLGGKMTTYERDRAFIENLTDYQAEAKLGLKF